MISTWYNQRSNIMEQNKEIKMTRRWFNTTLLKFNNDKNIFKEDIYDSQLEALVAKLTFCQSFTTPYIELQHYKMKDNVYKIYNFS